VIGFHETLPREQRTERYHHDNILNELLQTLAACAPDADHDLLRWLVYRRGTLDGFSGDAMGQHWRAENKGKLDLPHLVLIASAYCADAFKGIDQEGTAWPYLMEAQRHLGMCRAAKAARGQSDQARAMVAREARAAHAGNSGAANARIWHCVKDEAFRLIRERVRDGARWDSRAEAARAIGPQVQAFLTKLYPGRRFSSKTQQEIQIASWLGDMPEAASLFARPPKKS